MIKKILTEILLLAAIPVSGAQPLHRHQLRLGWGDMLFETLAFHPSLSSTYPKPEVLPATFRTTETFQYGYTGHLYAEYSYHFSKLVSVGFQADAEGIFWKRGEFDRYHQLTAPAVNVRNWDVVLMPTVRFTYLNKPMVRLYSGLGAGAVMAFDNEGEFKAGLALNLNWIGIEIGKGRWGGNIELGMLNSLTDYYHIYQIGSRLVSFGAYYKW